MRTIIAGVALLLATASGAYAQADTWLLWRAIDVRHADGKSIRLEIKRQGRLADEETCQWMARNVAAKLAAERPTDTRYFYSPQGHGVITTKADGGQIALSYVCAPE